MPCARADCPRGTVITPPFERRTTNLLRQVHLGPRKADRWVSAQSTATEPAEGSPARVHPASPVIEHRLTEDTAPETNSLCGVVLTHGLVPGVPYVLSMDVWITEEASLERAGAVFTGLAAIQYGPADLGAAQPVAAGLGRRPRAIPRWTYQSEPVRFGQGRSSHLLDRLAARDRAYAQSVCSQHRRHPGEPRAETRQFQTPATELMHAACRKTFQRAAWPNGSRRERGRCPCQPSLRSQPGKPAG